MSCGTSVGNFSQTTDWQDTYKDLQNYLCRPVACLRVERYSVRHIGEPILHIPKGILDFPFDDISFLLFKATLFALFVAALVKLLRGAFKER